MPDVTAANPDIATPELMKAISAAFNSRDVDRIMTFFADDEMKAKAAKDAEAAIAQPLEVYREFFLQGKRFIGGDSPSIADIRLAATLEFLRAVDYDFPGWAEDYMQAMEQALGDAYTEPATDVRGFVEQVKAPA